MLCSDTQAAGLLVPENNNTILTHADEQNTEKQHTDNSRFWTRIFSERKSVFSSSLHLFSLRAFSDDSRAVLLDTTLTATWPRIAKQKQSFDTQIDSANNTHHRKRRRAYTQGNCGVAEVARTLARVRDFPTGGFLNYLIFGDFSGKSRAAPPLKLHFGICARGGWH